MGANLPPFVLGRKIKETRYICFSYKTLIIVALPQCWAYSLHLADKHKNQGIIVIPNTGAWDLKAGSSAHEMNSLPSCPHPTWLPLYGKWCALPEPKEDLKELLSGLL